MRRPVLALVVCAFAAAGCELPGDAPVGGGFDLSGVIQLDGGVPDGGPGRLRGNRLDTDGGERFARLWFNITDGDTQAPIPARVIFRPPPGAGFADSITHGKFDPQSPGSFTGAVVGPSVLGSPEGVLLMNGAGVVPVPPGTYSLFITRGPEYEAVEASVTVGPDQDLPVRAQLDRTVDTRGWLAADMHVHINRSGDSQLLADRRVISMVTNGVELIVPTDHNVNSDLTLAISQMGYTSQLVASIPGDEYNFKYGHASAFPVAYEPNFTNGGALPYQEPNDDGSCDVPIYGLNCAPPAMAFSALHAQVPGTTVVTVTHPYWPLGDLGYFTNINWGAGTSGGFGPLDSAGSFDALEVLNGYQARADVQGYLVADWFYLLGQGYRVTALGNSDTHRINWVRGGFPRTWLRLPTDVPGDVGGAELADAVRRGRAIASTGPFVTLTVDGAQIGDTITPLKSQVAVTVTVDAPAWMTVDTVRIYVNGNLAQTFPIAQAGQRPLFNVTFNQSLPRAGDGPRDGWIVAFASGQTPLPDDVVGEYSKAGGYHMMPWAITNPIFIDAEGDGIWHPPPAPAQPSGFGLEGLTPARERALPLRVPVECDARRPGPHAELDGDALPPGEQLLMPLLNP